MDTRTNKKPRTGIWVRRSVEEKFEKVSLENQIEICKAKCEAEGFEVVAIFREEESAYNTPIEDRPVLQEVIQLALNGGIEVLMSWQSGRLVRSLYDQVILQKILLQDAGIKVIFADASDRAWSVDEYDVLVSMLHGWRNENEVTELRRRVKQHMRQYADRGLYVGGSLTGYEWNKHTKRMEKVPNEIEIVESIYHMYLHEGYSTIAIAKALNMQGKKTKYGKLFYPATVGSILRNKLYCGYYRWGFTTSRRRNTPEKAEGYETKADWIDPIITLEDWERVQDRMISRAGKKRGQKNNIATTSPFLLSGILYCGCCGKKLGARNGTTQYVRKNGEKVKHPHFRYVCNGTEKHGFKPYYNAHLIDHKVLQKTMELASALDSEVVFNAAKKETETKKGSLNTELNELTRYKARLEKEIQTLFLNVGSTTNPDLVDMYNQRMLDLGSKQKQNEVRIAELKRSLEQSQLRLEDVEAYLEMIKQFAFYEQFSPAKKKLFVDNLIEKVIITNDQLDIFLKWDIRGSLKGCKLVFKQLSSA